MLHKVFSWTVYLILFNLENLIEPYFIMKQFVIQNRSVSFCAQVEWKHSHSQKWTPWQTLGNIMNRGGSIIVVCILTTNMNWGLYRKYAVGEWWWFLDIISMCVISLLWYEVACHSSSSVTPTVIITNHCKAWHWYQDCTAIYHCTLPQYI